MPEICEEGIPRRIYPIFILVQKFGDKRDETFKNLINIILRQCCEENKTNPDLETKIYYAQFDSETMFETKALLDPVTDLQELETEKVDIKDISLKTVLSVVSEKMSRKRLFNKVCGYRVPQILFFINDLDFDVEDTMKCCDSNKWCEKSIKSMFVFNNLNKNYENAFTIPEDSDEEQLQDLFYNSDISCGYTLYSLLFIPVCFGVPKKSVSKPDYDIKNVASGRFDDIGWD